MKNIKTLTEHDHRNHNLPLIHKNVKLYERKVLLTQAFDLCHIMKD